MSDAEDDVAGYWEPPEDAADAPVHDELSRKEQERLEFGERLASVYLQSSDELLASAKLEPDWLVPGAVPASAVSFMVGKPGCLSGDTVLQINRGGASVKRTIKEVFEKQNGVAFDGRPWDKRVPTQIARAEGGVVRLATVAAVWESGEKEVFEVTTMSGRTIKASADHPFLTFTSGFVPVRDLRPGVQVAVNIGLPSGTNARTQGRRVNYPDVNVLHHPHQRRAPTGFRVPLHRLAYEAGVNKLSTETMIWILNSDAVAAGQLTYLHPRAVVHHKDGNPQNNAYDNLEAMSAAEHSAKHRPPADAYTCLQRIGYEPIVSIQSCGREMTYDLEVVGDPHNFLANDFVVHNSAKSWLAYDLALAVIQQRDWIGFGTPTAGIAPSAMILNFDNPHPECARRYLRLGLQPGQRLWTHSFGAHTPPEPLPPILQLPDAFEPLEAMVYARRPSIIVIDSLRQAHTGDESSSQEMARVMGQVKRLAMFGAAVVIVHHSRKNDGAMRGSTEIEATADAITDIEREADVSLVSWRKTRGWEMSEPTVSISVVDEGDRTFVRGGISVSALLAANGPMTRSAITTALRMNQAQAKKLVDRGVERGTLTERRTPDGGRVIELVPQRG